jgi:hypothetical protein
MVRGISPVEVEIVALVYSLLSSFAALPAEALLEKGKWYSRSKREISSSW